MDEAAARVGSLRLHRDAALRVYRQATALAAGLRDDAEGIPADLAALLRVAQRCVDVAEQDAGPLVALTRLDVLALEPEGAPVPTHAANVMVLSIVLAREVGLDRPSQARVGLAALAHDAGCGAGTDPAAEAVAGAARLLRLGRFAAVARPALVALERGTDALVPETTGDLELAARIVAIADSYADLARHADLAGRPARAIAALRESVGTRFDADLVTCLERVLEADRPA
jgi:HD-GYP domain-containing protein (c-di-GMP phosphodiesterase class II)